MGGAISTAVLDEFAPEASRELWQPRISPSVAPWAKLVPFTQR
jgi:hypothetical protein